MVARHDSGRPHRNNLGSFSRLIWQQLSVRTMGNIPLGHEGLRIPDPLKIVQSDEGPDFSEEESKAQWLLNLSKVIQYVGNAVAI